tara:strand:- start:4425 stop:5468 length:1044 start_codon:yes stop_codon:yes gene_type:complete
MSDVFKITCPECGKKFDPGSAIDAHIKSVSKQEQEKIRKEAEKKSKSQIDTLKSELISKDKEFEKIKKESDEKAALKLEKKYKEASKKREKENEINNRRLYERLDRSEKQNQEMKKLLKQKSTEVQGEVQEELIEDFLRRKFPTDQVIPIKKGEKGGDCIFRILDQNKKKIGEIYFESKDREKTFNEKWIDKLLKDMENRNIGYGILVSAALPKDFKKDSAYVSRHNSILIVPMSYQLIHSVVSFIKSEMVQKSKNSKDFDAPAEMKRMWSLVTSDQFHLALRSLFLKIIKIEKSLLKQKTFFEKNIADQENILIDMHDGLKKIVLSFRSKIGNVLPDKLLEPPEEK